jgi:glyoxylase-like metal-dependent hydrolase (beta-lactamase superfamily II)
LFRRDEIWEADQIAKVAYTRGLHELGDGLFAYLQPDGGWGWSNAGLVTAGDTSLLIDTLFDIPLTREMLEAMRSITATRPIDAAVNTHGNGDHCWGNGALPEQISIYATARAVEDMREEPPALVQTLLTADLGPELGEFAARLFGPFHFEGLEARLPSQTFEGRLELRVGERVLELIEVGPAHTRGDAIIHVPDAATVFTGDILFAGGTPVVWAGPSSNWIAACDLVIGLGARTLVPGHGPVTDNGGLSELKRYLEYVRDWARQMFDAGVDPLDAADEIELGEFAEWSAPERIVQNVEQFYCEFDPHRTPTSKLEIYQGMARWAKRHRT